MLSTPESTSADRITVRDLPYEEWGRLTTYPPFDSGGLPDPRYWHIIVAEQAGRILSFVGLHTELHVEPVYFDPEVRHHPKLFMGMWQATRGVIEGAGAQVVFATIDDTRPDLQELWTKFGFIAAPGRMYIGDLDRLP